MQTKRLSNGQEVWVSTFTGEVLSSDKTSALSIHQDAPTVLSNKLLIPSAIHSRNVVTHEVWLRSPDGKERQVNLGTIGLSVRAGHVVTIAWGATQALDQGPNLGARNHTTGETTCDVLKTVDSDLKAWKLDVGATASFWRWTIGGTILGAVVGGLWGRATAYAHSVPQDTLTGMLALGIAAFVLTALFWLFIGMNFLLNGKVKALLGEIDNFVREQLLAAQPEAGTASETARPVETMSPTAQTAIALG